MSAKEDAFFLQNTDSVFVNLTEMPYFRNRSTTTFSNSLMFLYQSHENDVFKTFFCIAMSNGAAAYSCL
jgi:hypothetical protein